ncbi:ATP synthase F1 subunit delta [Kineothrix sp. MB12-C1]|uniref:ATP synthase F1 subunit delta n=1 Tax=Kineothrix sp. MB12-C1 TaxID=3070215 RepID=UPI0027D220F1|nr:ATP synthase F1 subunit delta [Kineothrix sp. MB12-C1]WMC94119.1 ATP synthase F1 subunit delta [Kineothrix sp. MB12-C1]
MAKLVSKVYGEALFELAVEEEKVDVFVEEMEGIKAVLAENPEFSRLMNHPKVLKEEKVSVLENVFKGRICDELTGFLTLIVTKDRYGELDGILDYFLAEIKKFKGIGVATVTTATTLLDEQKIRIEQKLLETTSYEKMEMNYAEDKELIGGMVIRIGDRVVDSSVRTKLNELTRQLIGIQLS